MGSYNSQSNNKAPPATDRFSMKCANSHSRVCVSFSAPEMPLPSIIKKLAVAVFQCGKAEALDLVHAGPFLAIHLRQRRATGLRRWNLPPHLKVEISVFSFEALFKRVREVTFTVLHGRQGVARLQPETQSRSLGARSRNVNRMLRIACPLAFALCGLRGQALPSLPSFEVASIRPVDRTGQMGHGSMAVSGPHITFTGYTLRGLILYAYDMRNYQISGGPDWMASVTYTVAAKAEGNAAPETAEVRAMLQRLLAERFEVKLHHETKEFRLYLLEPAKTGPKLTLSIARRTTMQMGPGHLMMAKATTAQMAALLSSVINRPVIDQTRMNGEFDFSLDSSDINMARMAPPDEELSGPSIFTAIQEQLGLRLEPSKGPIEILVIDHAVKPADN
jgi:uncharacterized protein (TIGR03435 family)